MRILLHIFQSLLFEMECLCCISLFKSSNEIPGDKGETTVLSAKQDSTSKPLPISVVVYIDFFNHTSFYFIFWQKCINWNPTNALRGHDKNNISLQEREMSQNKDKIK